ncbi:MAG TPA: MTH1187 family thiamine-binding protein [Tenuifilaceae bacterium]|nr:MTH1187 family thiamine-binding protein [Tenuifilaceae bacterium]
MSVVMSFAIFPTDKSESVSPYVARVIDRLKTLGVPFQLTSMNTIVETDEMKQALSVFNEAYSTLEKDCHRIYLSVNFDIRKGKSNRMESKVRSVEGKLE